MSGAQLNHTIVWCRDKGKSAAFLTDLLALPAATEFGPMLVVKLANGVSLDFYENDNVSLQHYAFLVEDEEFDRVLARIQARALDYYWADPARSRAGETNRHYGGRGVYFQDPDGHLLEVITRPYGSMFPPPD